MITTTEFYSAVPFCLCGDSTAALNLLTWVLASGTEDEEQRSLPWGEYTSKVRFKLWIVSDDRGWLMLYALDRLGLIEHGVGISSFWLTDLGDSVLAFLLAYGADEGDFPEDTL